MGGGGGGGGINKKKITGIVCIKAKLVGGWWYMPPVVLQKTITIFAIVTQVYFAIVAVPKCVVSLILVVTAIVTPMPFI